MSNHHVPIPSLLWQNSHWLQQEFQLRNARWVLAVLPSFICSNTSIILTVVLVMLMLVVLLLAQGTLSGCRCQLPTHSYLLQHKQHYVKEIPYIVVMLKYVLLQHV